MFALTQRHRTVLAFVSGGLIAISALAWLTNRFVQSAPAALTTAVIPATLTTASVLAGYPILIRALQALRMRAFSIDLLVSVAVIGALIIGEYVESAVVSFLFLFGAWLEARSLERTRASLAELIDLAPTSATVIRNGERLVVAADEVKTGDTVIVLTGERIAVDGTVTEGSAEVSEASITGESVPAAKSEGATVFAGTIVESGFIALTANRVGDDTTFARMIELVEEAQESTTSRQRFLDRFATYYTPAIIVTAVIAALVTRDVSFALTFLVIACPGALVISVPVAAVAGLGNIARRGVLVKDAESLETLATATELIVDKTGTLTAGTPSVTRVVTKPGFTETELLTLAAAIETVSEHHSARTIVAEAHSRGVHLAPVSETKLTMGVGVAGVVSGRHVVVGRRSLLDTHSAGLTEQDAAEATARETTGSTLAYVAIDGDYAGYIELSDQVRPDALEAITSLRAHGISRVTMLTGDNPHIAQHVADELGLDEVHASLLPEDKVSFVAARQQAGHTVAMVGDGANDAAALATADVGIAMGDSGTDISVETADVVLLGGKLAHLAHAQVVAARTLRIMRQNMVISLGTVALLIAGVLIGQVHLASGMLIHEVSVLLVIINALRLSRVGDAVTRRAPSQVHPSERTLPATV